MTAKQYRAAIARLGLSQRAAARKLGINERTSRRWAQQGAPKYVALLLETINDPAYQKFFENLGWKR